MHIHDVDNDTVTSNAVLYLKASEAQELVDDLKALLKKPQGNHAHINSDDYKKEITICIYDIDNLDDFDDVSREIILSEKQSE
jgi:hypothetical protein